MLIIYKDNNGIDSVQLTPEEIEITDRETLESIITVQTEIMVLHGTQAQNYIENIIKNRKQ